MKKYILLVAIALICSISNGIAQVVSGTTGEVEWSLNVSMETLVISGNGAMKDYNYYMGYGVNDVPWREYAQSIRRVVVEEGVTYVGTMAFLMLPINLLTISKSVINIGEGALGSCPNLTSATMPIVDNFRAIFKPNWVNEPIVTVTSITIPEGTEVIKYYAPVPHNPVHPGYISPSEYLRPFRHIIIPSSVTTIESDVFNCPDLETVTVHWDNPITIPSNAFKGFNKTTCSLIVPTGTLNVYKSANGWKDFNVVEEGTGISSTIVDDDSPVISTQYYNLQGQEVTHLQHGQIYIAKELHQSGKTTVGKIAY